MTQEQALPGRIEVIYGPMFSGKTNELLRRLRLATLEGKRVVAAKPVLDGRVSPDWIVSHTGARTQAVSVASTVDLLRIADGASIVGVDELQFFPVGAEESLNELRMRGVRIVAAGLDLDFARRPFGCTAALITRSDLATRLTARCSRCGSQATLTQRIVDGVPCSLDQETVRIGANDLYQPRCAPCYATERERAVAARRSEIPA